MTKREASQAEIVHESAPLERYSIDPQALIQSGIEKGTGIEVMERLFELAKNVQAERARQAWFDAMAAFQATCPRITKASTGKGAGYSFKYASLDDIMSIISEPMGKQGLSVSYRFRHEGERVFANCRISHAAGHYEESGEIAMPIVPKQADGSAATNHQRIGIAMTYARRYSLLAITGLAPEKDEDPDGGEPDVQMPGRASQQGHADPPTDGNVWIGKVKVATKNGTSKAGKPYTLHTLTGDDGTTFGSFSDSIAKFAREAGTSPVLIRFTPTDRGGKNVVAIEPAPQREPGDEDAGA